MMAISWRKVNFRMQKEIYAKLTSSHYYSLRVLSCTKYPLNNTTDIAPDIPGLKVKDIVNDFLYKTISYFCRILT
jgi:hypothetical protein